MIRLFMVISLCIPLATLADFPSSFSQSKRLAKQIYLDYAVTFYCNCSIEIVGNKWIPQPESCGYEPRNPVTRSGNPNRRATRVEWEHVVPAWVLGHQRQCWQKGGRKNCQKTDQEFKRMEADLHNLVPAIGELNADRRHYKFSMITGEPREYGLCDFEVDRSERVAEPAPHIRGDIARIYFYMAEKYGIRLSSQQNKLFAAWEKQDLVDSVECDRDKRIARVQGNHNPFVAEMCQPGL